MAEERGLTVRVLDFDPVSCRYDLRQLDELRTSRTPFGVVSFPQR